MIKNNLYSQAMSASIDYVVKNSGSDHIHSVHWTERGTTKETPLYFQSVDAFSFVNEYEYVDILIETTNNEGEAHEEWSIRVLFERRGSFLFPVILPKYVNLKLLK
jgi:hypothetical protein